MVGRMRIWLAPSRYLPHLGGIESVVAQLAQELRAAGDDILVLTHREPADLPAEEVLDGVRIRRLRFESPGRDLSAAHRFLGAHRTVGHSLDAETRPDVIHLHGGANQSFHLTRYSGKRRIKLILTTHGEISGDVHDLYGRSAYARASFRFAARRAAAVTAPSRHTLEEADRLAAGIALEGRVVPNGIDATAWRQCPTPASTGRVLAWGRLEPQKGFDRLLAAWPLVRRELPHAELRLAGEGGQRRALEALASPGVHLLGRLDRSGLLEELADTQIAAVPSRVEAFGMSALEALASGRPVLHAGLPALSELVGPYGWEAPHDDPQSLAKVFVSALSAPPVAVPQQAVESYQWSGVVQAYRSLYRGAAPPDRPIAGQVIDPR